MSRRDLIFDLDDTLVQSFPSDALLHCRVAADLGWRIPSRAELIEREPNWHDTLARLWPDQDLDAFVARYEALLPEHPCSPVYGAAHALGRLMMTGYRLWVVTMRDRPRLMQRIREAKLPVSLFRGVFCREDVPEPKPSPRVFEPITHALGHPPSRPIYVGDREVDRLTARAAGIEFVAVCTGPERAKGFPYDHPVSHVLPSVLSLPAWLE